MFYQFQQHRRSKGEAKASESRGSASGVTPLSMENSVSDSIRRDVFSEALGKSQKRASTSKDIQEEQEGRQEDQQDQQKQQKQKRKQSRDRKSVDEEDKQKEEKNTSKKPKASKRGSEKRERLPSSELELDPRNSLSAPEGKKPLAPPVTHAITKDPPVGAVRTSKTIERSPSLDKTDAKPESSPASIPSSTPIPKPRKKKISKWIMDAAKEEKAKQGREESVTNSEAGSISQSIEVQHRKSQPTQAQQSAGSQSESAQIKRESTQSQQKSSTRSQQESITRSQQESTMQSQLEPAQIKRESTQSQQKSSTRSQQEPITLSQQEPAQIMRESTQSQQKSSTRSQQERSTLSQQEPPQIKRESTQSQQKSSTRSQQESTTRSQQERSTLNQSEPVQSKERESAAAPNQPANTQTRHSSVQASQTAWIQTQQSQQLPRYSQPEYVGSLPQGHAAVKTGAIQNTSFPEPSLQSADQTRGMHHSVMSESRNSRTPTGSVGLGAAPETSLPVYRPEIRGAGNEPGRISGETTPTRRHVTQSSLTRSPGGSYKDQTPRPSTPSYRVPFEDSSPSLGSGMLSTDSPLCTYASHETSSDDELDEEQVFPFNRIARRDPAVGVSDGRQQSRFHNNQASAHPTFAEKEEGQTSITLPYPAARAPTCSAANRYASPAARLSYPTAGTSYPTAGIPYQTVGIPYPAARKPYSEARSPYSGARSPYSGASSPSGPSPTVRATFPMARILTDPTAARAPLSPTPGQLQPAFNMPPLPRGHPKVRAMQINKRRRKARARCHGTSRDRRGQRSDSPTRAWMTPQSYHSPSPGGNPSHNDGRPPNPEQWLLALWLSWLLGLDEVSSLGSLMQRLLFRLLQLWFVSTFVSCLKRQIYQQYINYSINSKGV